MYLLLEYFALLALAVVAGTVAFGVMSLILVIREGLGWLAGASRRLFLREGGLFFSRRQTPRWHRASVEPMTRIARPAA